MKIKFISIIGLVCGLLLTGTVLAAAETQGLLLTNVSKTVSDSVGHLAVIMSNVALIAGIGFVMASFFKFHQHKLNPTQVPLSQGVTLLLIGAGLSLLPVLIPTAKNTVFGTTAKVSTLSGAGIRQLINDNSNQ